MAETPVYDKTSFGDKARNRSNTPPKKGDVDVFPAQFTLQCGMLEIHSDGKSQKTQVFIDGKPARGIYSLKINLNTQRATKIEFGVFMDDFEFQMRPRKENEHGGAK